MRMLLFVILLINLWVFLNWAFATLEPGRHHVTNPLHKPPETAVTSQSAKPTKDTVVETIQNTDVPKASPKPTKTAKKEDDPEIKKRQQAVKAAFLHAWRGYERYAWGHDELRPVSNSYNDNWGGLGVTIIDALDTIIVMGLDDVYEKAKEFVAGVNFYKNYGASTFETTIRVLGGLLGAYSLSEEPMFLTKAKEIADRLAPAFRSPSGVPYATVNLKSGKAWNPAWNSNNAFLAEFGSIGLEWRYLAHCTGEKKYADLVNSINDAIFEASKDTHFDGVLPVQFNVEQKRFVGSQLKLGARGDSFYELLLKQWLQTSKTEDNLKTMYDNFIVGLQKRLILTNKPTNLTYVVEQNNGRYVREMDHLVCFLPGVLALSKDPAILPLAKELMYTCYQFYAMNPTGIAPEIAGFNERKGYHNQAPHYLLRPETVESLFVMWRITKDVKYREWGWKIFQAIEKECKTPAGYSGIKDVGRVGSPKDDTMQSFFFAETLKYLYLLFSGDDLVPLDQYVFNTEAHPTKIFKPSS